MFPFTRAAQKKASVREKLAAIEAEISAAQAELQHASLDAVLSDDPAAGNAAMHKLNELRARRELLLSAIQEAERQEQAEREALAVKEHTARKHALAQHCGAMRRDTQAVAEALAVLRNAFRKMAATGASVIAVLPSGMRTDASPWHTLMGEAHLRALADVEALRLSREGAVMAPGVQALPMLLPQHENPRTGAITPLDAVIAELLSNCRAELEARSPIKTSPVADAPSAAVSAPASVDVFSSASADAAQRAGEVCDLRGQDLGIVKTRANEASVEMGEAEVIENV